MTPVCALNGGTLPNRLKKGSPDGGSVPYPTLGKNLSTRHGICICYIHGHAPLHGSYLGVEGWCHASHSSTSTLQAIFVDCLCSDGGTRPVLWMVGRYLHPPHTPPVVQKAAFWTSLCALQQDYKNYCNF